jgi:hypothetical protein
MKTRGTSATIAIFASLDSLSAKTGETGPPFMPVEVGVCPGELPVDEASVSRSSSLIRSTWNIGFPGGIRIVVVVQVGTLFPLIRVPDTTSLDEAYE